MLEEVPLHLTEYLNMPTYDEKVRKVLFYIPSSSPDSQLLSLVNTKSKQLSQIHEHKWYMDERRVGQDGIGLVNAAIDWFSKHGNKFNLENGLLELEAGLIFVTGERTNKIEGIETYKAVFITNTLMRDRKNVLRADQIIGYLLSKFIFEHNLVLDYLINSEKYHLEYQNFGDVGVFSDSVFVYPRRTYSKQPVSDSKECVPIPA